MSSPLPLRWYFLPTFSPPRQNVVTDVPVPLRLFSGGVGTSALGIQTSCNGTQGGVRYVGLFVISYWWLLNHTPTETLNGTICFRSSGFSFTLGRFVFRVSPDDRSSASTAVNRTR